MALLVVVLAASSSIVVWAGPLEGAGRLSRPRSPCCGRARARWSRSTHLRSEHSQPSADVHLDVTLKLPDPSAVTAFITSLSDRSSPNFQHFLRPGQFGRLFGPPLSEVAAVDAVLRSDGLHPGQVSSNRLSIPVTAPASAIDRAFHVRLRELPVAQRACRVHDPVGTEHLGIRGRGRTGGHRPQRSRPAPELGRALDQGAQGSPVRQGSPSTGRRPGPTPCAAATKVAEAYGSYTADQLASYYDMTPLYALGDFGQGVHVALVEIEQDSPTDIAAYQSCYRDEHHRELHPGRWRRGS